MLSFEQVLDDVLSDFERYYVENLDSGRFYAPFNQIVYPVAENLAEQDIYTYCNCCIWEMYCRFCGSPYGLNHTPTEVAEKRHKDTAIFNNLSYEEMVASLKNSIGIITDPAWSERLNGFKWEPAELKQVYDDSFAILTQAKRCYYLVESDELATTVVRGLLERINKAKDQLESLTYIYRPKEEIMERYNAELSECVLDAKAVEEHTTDISRRLREYDEFLRCAAYRELWSGTSDIGSVNPYISEGGLTGNTTLEAREGYWIPNFVK